MRERIAQVLIAELETLPATGQGIALPRDPGACRVAIAMLKAPADARRLEDWASSERMSVRTLSRRFSDETGLSFTEWRRRARLVRSLEMLTTPLSVTRIAADLGYPTTSAFIAHFRCTFGVTPARYRKRVAS